jgi:hypothetical protein
VEFAQDVAQVILDGELSQHQALRDLFVCVSLRYKLEYFLLAGSGVPGRWQ